MPKADKKECVWSNNHHACVNTWSGLRFLNQLKELFDDAKNVPMSELTFWNPTASAEMRKAEARTLATSLDRMYTHLLLAKYEDGFNITSAIEKLTSDLLVDDKTVCELACTVDDIYAFM